MRSRRKSLEQGVSLSRATFLKLVNFEREVGLTYNLQKYLDQLDTPESGFTETQTGTDNEY